MVAQTAGGVYVLARCASWRPRIVSASALPATGRHGYWQPEPVRPNKSAWNGRIDMTPHVRSRRGVLISMRHGIRRGWLVSAGVVVLGALPVLRAEASITTTGAVTAPRFEGPLGPGDTVVYPGFVHVGNVGRGPLNDTA